MDSESTTAAAAHKARDPGFLMPLVLHVLAEPLFLLVVLMMRSLPASVHFALEPRQCSPRRAAARLGASLVQRISGRSLRLSGGL